MSQQQACVLTTKDLTILEIMLDRYVSDDDSLVPIIKSKIESALVVFRDDVPANVATLSSRVTFSIDGQDPQTRVITHDRMTSPVGMFLPITTLRGLALLGLAEGEEFRLANHESVEERIVLEKVLYQPEAARRQKEAASISEPQLRKPALRLIRGAFYDQPNAEPVGPGGFDDPGPSAA